MLHAEDRAAKREEHQQGTLMVQAMIDSVTNTFIAIYAGNKEQEREHQNQFGG